MSDPKQYDDVIGMLTDQCHQYALEVERLKAAPHDDDTCPHLVVLGLLQAENARLKAEVERLTAEPDALTAYLYADTLRRDDIKTLKEQVERLTKAGDAMAQAYAQECMDERGGIGSVIETWLNGLEPIKRWNAAKEGKPRA